MGKYKICPRCELNYILAEEDYCPICKDELRGIVTADLSLEDDFNKLCPRCGVNYIADDQDFCESCRADIEELNALQDAEDASWGGEEKVETVSLDEMTESVDVDDVDMDDASIDELDDALVLDDSMLAELQSEDEDGDDMGDEDGDGMDDDFDFDEDLDDEDFDEDEDEDFDFEDDGE